MRRACLRQQLVYDKKNLITSERRKEKKKQDKTNK